MDTTLSFEQTMDLLNIFTLGRNDRIEDSGRHWHAQYTKHPDHVKAVGRKPVRYFIDGSPLINDICQTWGECLETLSFGDKLQLLFQIADTLQHLEQANGATLNPYTEKAASVLTDIPIDAHQALFEGLMDDSGHPITRHIDGFESIDYLVERFGSHLQDLTPIDHYLLIKEAARHALFQVQDSEVIAIMADDIDEVCNRLDELYDDYNNGLYLMEAIAANLQ
ncbi:hypothetical protein NIES267_71640 (plasmid) [Calothrix parasitica NIES-267]|uniref:Uncharacterized protein n=1 Tax=Calothrix parasitica NIES-267 TaxID=1973488 RepID=A0A1Z4M2E2_9CYAN|nr:hypothetical protein NIES267_71640 [Calothrix parasitica NIES-267]